MSSGQAWWADHEESLEHIRGECSCDLTFRKRCGMAPPIPNAVDIAYDDIDGSGQRIIDKDGRELNRDWTSDWGRSPEMRGRLAQERSEKSRRIAELRSELRKLEAL